MDYFSFIWCFWMGIVIGIPVVYEQYAKREMATWLAREIESKGGELVTLRQTEGPSRYNHNRKFEVVLASRTGQKYTTTCKVDWSNSELYWSVSPTELLNKQGWTFFEMRETTKMLSELNSPFLFARLAAVRELAQTQPLPDELLTRLVQMAAEDEDPQVREEAKAIVRVL